VDSADAVLRLVGRDVRAALPNSIRVLDTGTSVALEVLNVVDAVRYRDSGANSMTSASQELDFSGPDDSFASLSRFEAVTKPFVTTAHYLSIYNVGVPGADAYSLTNVITPAGRQITIRDSTVTANEDEVLISPAFQFVYGSPARRVYLVSGPVKYICNESNNTIRRYSNYTIAGAQSASPPGGAGVIDALVASNVASCQFDYVAGTAARAGLVSLRVTFTKSGESIWLAHQVHVENAP
jgi:MSHA biogenesis protein MshO